MVTVIEPTETVVRIDEAGVMRIGETRVSLDSVVYTFNEGATAQEIVFRYPWTNLMHTSPSSATISKTLLRLTHISPTEKVKAAGLRAEIEAKFSPVGIRERLIS